MKFYSINIQQPTGAEETVQTIFVYNTKEEALSVYHQNLAYNYTVGTLDAFSCMVINEHGGTEIKEYWEKPEPTPNEE